MYNLDKTSFSIEDKKLTHYLKRNKYLFINGKPLTRKDKVTYKCISCGKQVVIDAERFARKKKGKKLCWNCQLSYSKRNSKLRFRNEKTKEKLRLKVRENGKYIDKWEDRICPQCGKKFTVRLARSDKRRIYCSNKCRIEALKAIGSKQGHYGYKGLLSLEKTKQTKIEKYCEDLFKENNIKFEYNKKVGKYLYDFYLPEKNLLIEVDGDFFHFNPKTQSNIIKTFQIKKIVQDAKKTKFCINNNKKLIRVWESEITDLNSILNKPINEVRKFDFNDVLLSKEFLLSLSTEELENLTDVILEWVRLYFPKFQINYNAPTYQEIILSLNKNKNLFWKNPNTRQVIGNYFLKNRFLSFWKGHVGHRKSIYEAYYDDEIMKKIIKYRVGLNHKRETFDISLKNIIRGFISGGYAISWFSPKIAFEIISKFKPNVKTMYDPCMGFGARLLGFKAAGGILFYGNDLNDETVEENKKLAEEININYNIFNEKAEDLIPDFKVDIAFTCPPYFNNEKYSKNTIEYSSIKNEFLYPMIYNMKKSSDLVVLVVNSFLKEIIEEEFKIKEEIILTNGKSHFKKNTSYEYIIRI